MGLSTQNNLWASAVGRLSEADRAHITPDGQDQLETLSHLQKITATAKDQCIKKRWKLPRRNGQSIILRDLFSKILVWVDVFMQIGDRVVQYEPAHAALPWAGIRFVLQMISSDIDTFGFLVEQIEMICHLIGRYAIFEDVYLHEGSNFADQLGEALTRLYASVLLFLSKAKSFFEQNTAVRMLSGAAIVPDMFERLSSTIAAEQVNMDRYAALVDAKMQEQRYDKLLELFRTLESPIIRMEGQVDKIEDHLDKSKRIEILRWLSPQPFVEYHEQVFKTALPGTGKWLLEHPVYNRWLKESKSSLLWLHGKVGSGKSTLVSIMIDDVMAKFRAGLCPVPVYFYCSRNAAESERSNPAAILASVVRQLSCSRGDLPILTPAIEKYNQKGQGFASNGLRLEESRQVILELVELYPIVFIFIDALDEVNPEVRHDLLDALEHILRESIGLVKLFVSSRDDQDIVCTLKGYPSLDVSSDRNAADIEAFIRKETGNLVQKRRLLYNSPAKEELIGLIIDKVSKGADGMFRWASLQLELLCAVKLEADVRTMLGRLPPKLEQLYFEIHERLISSQPGEISKSVVRRILKWLLCAQRQITSSELRLAIVLNMDVSLTDLSKDRVLELCHNLIILDEGLDVFRFAHLSVREFLEKQPEYSQVSCHLIAAEACLLQLIAASRSPVAGSFLKSECKMDVREDFQSTTEKSSRGFHDYAALFWHEHCQMAGEEERTRDLGFTTIFRFFLFEDSPVTSPLSTWLRSHKRRKDVELREGSLLTRTLFTSPSHFFRVYFVACARGFSEIVQEYLIGGGIGDFEWNQGIELAVYHAHSIIFRILWSARDGVDISEHVFELIAGKLLSDDLEWLLDHSPEAKFTWPPDGSSASKFTRAVIQNAVTSGDVRVVNLILNRFGQYVVISEDLLARAAIMSSVQSFEILLARARENAISDKLLRNAILGGHPRIFSMLLNRKHFSITPSLLRHGIEGQNDEVAQLLVDRVDEATISKVFYYEVNKTSRAGIGRLLELLHQRGIKICQTLSFAAIAKCSAPIGQLACELLGETVENSQYDILRMAASNTKGGPGVVTHLLSHVDEKRISEEVLMAAIHNYRFRNELLRIMLDEKRELEITENVIEAAIRLLDFDDTLQYLLDLIQTTGITEQCFEAAAANERFGADLVKWMIDNANANLNLIDKLIGWATTNVGSGLEILLLLKARFGDLKITYKMLLTVALYGLPETLAFLLDNIDEVNASKIDENVIIAAVRNEASMFSCEGLKLLLRRCQGVSVSEELLQSAARETRDVNAFEMVWSRRRSDQITDGLVQAAAENKVSSPDILIFLLEETAKRSNRIELGENAMEAMFSHSTVREQRIYSLLDVAVGQGITFEITQNVIRNALSLPNRNDGEITIFVLSKFCTDIVVSDDVFRMVAGSGNEENLGALSSFWGMSEIPSKWVDIARLRNAVLCWSILDNDGNQVQELLERGADPNIPNLDGETPLFLAVAESHVEVAHQLLAAGANPNHRDNEDYTPLFNVAASLLPGSDKLADILLSAGADPNAMSEDGNTPLFLAARHGSYDFVQKLLEKGATACVRNRKGDTPSSLAKENGHIKIYRLLERHENEQNMRNGERQEK